MNKLEEFKKELWQIWEKIQDEEIEKLYNLLYSLSYY